MRDKCSKVAGRVGPYDRLVRSLGKRDAVVSFNWDVLLELAFRRNAIPYFYWHQSGGRALLKPHGSINWFALLDREMLSVDVATTTWDVFGHDLTYYLLFLKDPLGSRGLGKSSSLVNAALARVAFVLTAREVKFIEQNKANCILCVVHGITIKGKQIPKAAGGTLSVVEPFDLTRGKLTPIAFAFRRGKVFVD